MDVRTIGVTPDWYQPRRTKKYTMDNRISVGRPAEPRMGARVRELVKERYGSQTRAAQAWGCSRQYVSEVCRDEKPPSRAIREDLGL